MTTDYDEFDYKVRDAKYGDSVELSFTNNGFQWNTIAIPTRHAQEVGLALAASVSEEPTE